MKRIVTGACATVAAGLAALIVFPNRRASDDIDRLCDDPDFNGGMP